MKYEIQFIAMPDDENWQEHSTTHYQWFAQEIATLLLKQGKAKVRINQIQETVTLGPIQSSRQVINQVSYN